jgi:hypothetical protein
VKSLSFKSHVPFLIAVPVLSFDFNKVTAAKESFTPTVQRITNALEAFRLRLIVGSGRCICRLMLGHPDFSTHAKSTAALVTRSFSNARPSLVADQLCHKDLDNNKQSRREWFAEKHPLAKIFEFHNEGKRDADNPTDS